MYDRIRIVTTANSDRGLIAMFIKAWEKLSPAQRAAAPAVVER